MKVGIVEENQVDKNMIGINDPCFCGTGKKYKQCCIKKNEKSNASDNRPPMEISKAILKIAEPLMTKYPKGDRFTFFIDMAIAAWNISLASEEVRAELEDEIIKNMPEEIDAVDIVAIAEQMDMLVERKNKLYPDITYLIVSYNLKLENDGDLTLDIKSAPIVK